MTEINKDQITVVKQFNKLENKSIVYKERPKFNFFGFKSKTIFVGFMHRYDIHEKLYPFSFFAAKDSSIYEENKKVYYKPLLKIYLSDGDVVNKHFESIEELEAWKTKNLKGVKLIEV